MCGDDSTTVEIFKCEEINPEFLGESLMVFPHMIGCSWIISLYFT